MLELFSPKRQAAAIALTHSAARRIGRSKRRFDEGGAPCNHQRMTGLRGLLLLGLAQAGCAATSGQEWLNAPVEQQRALLPRSVETVDTVADAPPRLDHTVTLGESYAPYPARNAAVGAPAVQVNVPVVINNYVGYGYGSAYGSAYRSAVYGTRAFSAPVRATSSTSTSQKVGADFPKVPDYGPRAMR